MARQQLVERVSSRRSQHGISSFFSRTPSTLDKLHGEGHRHHIQRDFQPTYELVEKNKDQMAGREPRVNANSRPCWVQWARFCIAPSQPHECSAPVSFLAFYFTRGAYVVPSPTGRASSMALAPRQAGLQRPPKKSGILLQTSCLVKGALLNLHSRRLPRELPPRIREEVMVVARSTANINHFLWDFSEKYPLLCTSSLLFSPIIQFASSCYYLFSLRLLFLSFSILFFKSETCPTLALANSQSSTPFCEFRDVNQHGGALGSAFSLHCRLRVCRLGQGRPVD